jgi:Protein of unknown function, DUF547
VQILATRGAVNSNWLMGAALALLGVAGAIFNATPAVALDDPDAAFETLLQKHVVVGADGLNRVTYKAWNASKPDRAQLDGYIRELAGRKPSQFSKLQAFAYWANLYNAITLKVVIEKYPVASIKDIKSDGVWLDPKGFLGPWRAKRVTVEGRDLSLDDIEHEIMRPTFKDPRVHYTVNCASVGCPNLLPKPWRAATLEADLDEAAKAFVNHPRGVSVTAKDEIQVASIYQWFKADFGGDDAGVLAHLKKYASPTLAKKLEGVKSIARDTYDWNLNESSAVAK